MERRKQKIKRPCTRGKVSVPVVMQMEALECGAASLSMILAYYEKWVPLEQVRTDCGVSRDGSKASNVLKAARHYGMVANGYRYEPEELRVHGKFPCIIHWNFNHFVVLDGFQGNKVYLNDPARGPRTVTMEQFDASFTGVCIFMEPGEGFQPGGKPRSTMDFVRRRLKGTGIALLFTVLTTLIVSLIGIINPGFSRVFLDRLLPGKNPEWVLPFVGLLMLVSLLTVVVGWVQAVYQLKLNGKLAITANASYIWHVLRMPMGFFSQRVAGDVALRQSLNEGIANNLINTFAPLVLQTGMMSFYLLAMARYSPLLTAVGLVSILINVGMARLISKKRMQVSRIQMRDAGKLAGATVAGIEMIETIKASGAENGFFEKWAGYQAGENNQMVQFARINSTLGLIPNVVSVLTNLAVLLLGVFLTLNGAFTVGMITAFQGFLSGFTGPAQALISAGQRMQEMRSSMERIEDVMEYPVDGIYETADVSEEEEHRGKLSGTLEMRDVTFGYSPLDDPLITNFNLSLTPGKRVALVGASGCGKSTLAKLVSGLYQPWSGEILFDGKPISQIPREIFTGSVAVVDQDIVLFEDTIANNIKMWDDSIRDFEMILAARDAGLHEDIMAREGGYQYRMTEGGKDLSGGQRQRLEIARVLAQDPTLIIMDEATSALDSATEYQVTQAIANRGITCIVVAHRLSTIRDCEEILMLDKGEVVERGTHEELYALGGRYAQMVTAE